jgi:lysyl-tRNA synthetase class I
MRLPSQRWPYYTVCEDCGKIDRIWTQAVGQHERCVVIPF